MSAKRHDIEWKEFCSNNLAKDVKARSRLVKIRADWDEVKINVMREVLRIKFEIPELRDKLLATGDVQLVEGNNWGDEFWGVNSVTGVGLNHLGVLLMERREILKNEAQENLK
jgi:predicted NAD-dependent protein-ADP-ribosyltransferase YbiA (DUF1768 family)